MMPDIEEILKNSDKGVVLEQLADILESEGHKVVIIMGKPREDDLDIEVIQFGFKYRFEELGFIQEGQNIVEDCKE